MIFAGYNNEPEEFFKIAEENDPQTRRLISSIITAENRPCSLTTYFGSRDKGINLFIKNKITNDDVTSSQYDYK